MKQTLVLGLFAFVIAMAGSTWFVTKVSPPPEPVLAGSGPVAPAVKAPKAAKAAAPAAKPPAQPPAEPKVAAPDSGTGTPGGAAAKAPAPPAKVPGRSALDAEAMTRATSVAKVLVQMKPKEAVTIMAKLTDDEVERIFRQLNAKQLAALLAVLPGERAAVMSRRLLEPRTGREGGS